jgi:hypothetical protein
MKQSVSRKDDSYIVQEFLFLYGTQWLLQCSQEISIDLYSEINKTTLTTQST